MKTIYKVSDLRKELSTVDREGIGFVPTMGALHAGQRSLVERARRECATVVVSVFVNPTQFNDKNDLRNYPRTPEADMALLEAAGADYVLMPSVEEIYPEPDERIFDFGQIDKVMEGATRPGHFNGVAQVVSRLFAIVEPAKAYFGEKDFQEIARNTPLGAEHRKAAPRIYAVISQCAARAAEMTPAELTQLVTREVESDGLLKVIYFRAVDALTMQQVGAWSDSDRIQGCIAVQAGDIRLIDNVRIK